MYSTLHPASQLNPELGLALAAACAGHHDTAERARQTAARGRTTLTNSLTLVATLVAAYDAALVAVAG